MAKDREGKGFKKKYCKLCFEKVGFVDYKDDKRLGRFVTDRGKIVPRRVSGTCARSSEAAHDCDQAGARPGAAAVHQ